jgi:methenyltetrahydromethanopterin cyclohydrolase
MTNLPRISVNARAAALVERLRSQAADLRIAVGTGELGETLIDAGSRCEGGIAAGLRLAEICMGGLGTVEIAASAATPNWSWTLVVRSSQPVIACLASQYAGWKLSDGAGADAFFALGSGPARALARKEPLFAEIPYRDEAGSAVLVLESSRPPPAAVVSKVAGDCGVSPERLSFLYAPTQSLAGSVQVVARVLEVALHKTHELKFPLDRIVDGLGAAPLAPPHPDFVAAMGRTNDAIIYGGRVHLFVNGPANDAQALAEQLPSRRSRDFGRPFAEIFASFNRDFYAIDPMLFAPAAVIVTALETGESFHAGAVELSLLDAAFR